MVVNIAAQKLDDVSEVKPWSDLPAELLELIIGHLTVTDRFSFDRVCKRWSSIVRAVPPHNGLTYGLPCYASISHDGKECTLVDPLGNEVHIKCQNLPSPCLVLCSKSGWLLLLHPLDWEENMHSIFFFNPLTQTRIDLPNICCVYQFYYFAFSAPPISPNCMVIAVPADIESYVIIQICKRGDDKWTWFEDTNNQFPFTMTHVSPVFCNGRFYCLGDNGRLGVVDPTRNSWTVYPLPMNYLYPEPKDLYVVESDGELMMVFADELGDRVRIHKLDPLSAQWKDINNIGDTSLFVGRLASLCSKANVLMQNGVYFPRIKDGVYMFYSCQEGKFHPGGNFLGSRVSYESLWVDPVWFQPSHQEQLKWSQ